MEAQSAKARELSERSARGEHEAPGVSLDSPGLMLETPRGTGPLGPGYAGTWMRAYENTNSRHSGEQGQEEGPGYYQSRPSPLLVSVVGARVFLALLLKCLF